MKKMSNDADYSLTGSLLYMQILDASNELIKRAKRIDFSDTNSGTGMRIIIDIPACSDPISGIGMEFKFVQKE